MSSTEDFSPDNTEDVEPEELEKPVQTEEEEEVFDPYKDVSKTIEGVISGVMENFAPKESMYSISHRLMPVVSMIYELEKRWMLWVGIPKGLKFPLIEDHMFFTQMFQRAIKYSASRKGEGRKEVVTMLSAYFKGYEEDESFTEQIKGRFQPKDV